MFVYFRIFRTFFLFLLCVFLESLDFLRPPVKRVTRNSNRGTAVKLDSHTNNIKVLKEFRKQISKDCQYPQSKPRTAESSTSLILKKTTEREILQQYSVLSYSNLLGPRLQNPSTFPTHLPNSKEKPLIKVTVIPKTSQTQASNAIKRRLNLPKRIHTTVSNQENSIQTKNVYLVVKGRKREKVYEIKTTGSAKFANTRSKNSLKDEVIPLEQLSSLKLVLDSLNMDREKDTLRIGKPNNIDDYLVFSRTGNERFEECRCPNAVRDSERFRDCKCFYSPREAAASDAGKSHVRVTGHLGMTEDDRYVLRCAATVHDKPATSDFATVQQTSPHVCQEERKSFNFCNQNTCLTRCYNAATCSTQKRDFNIQADLQNENKWEMSPKPTIMQNKESQATQVNLNTTNNNKTRDVPVCKNTFPHKDEIIQCCRTNIDTNCANLTDSDTDSNSVKDCQSPLVIISVYPMQDCCDNVKIVKNYQDDGKYSSPRKPSVFGHSSQRPSSGTRQNNEKKVDNKCSRSRSRSPSPQNRNTNKHNVAETRVLRTNTRKASPGREVSSSINRPIQQNRINNERTNNKADFSKSRQKYGFAQINSSKETKGINTDHNVTKKILVDSYTKKLTDYLNNENGETKRRFPKSEPSKVTINIDGDKELYDVLFQHENSTTDLKFRKTVKGPACSIKRKTEDDKASSPTMKNLLLVNDERKRRTSPVRSKNQQKDDQKIKKTFSRLLVRDSIEISHRRDYKPPVEHTVIHNQKSKIDDDSGQFSAPIKHYRGDSCTIADPIKRDKEIRALLGVDKGIHSAVNQGLKLEENKFAVPLHYFYGKTQKKIVTGINIMEMPEEPPCVCCDIRRFCSSESNEAKPQTYQEPQPKPKSIHPASQRVPSQSSKKVHATSSQIDKEVAQQQPGSSDSASPEENVPPSPSPEESPPESPSPVEESPSPVEEPPSPVEESPSPVEEPPSPVVDKISRKTHKSSKSIRKSRANSTGTQYETQVQRTSLYQQLILNRNIQVFLQVEQFSKQKPIILSRKQYDKVKRTIESTIANKTGRDYKRKKCICKTSLVSVGDVRRKTNPGQPLHYDKQSQTNKKELAMNAKSTVSHKSKARSMKKQSRNTMVLFTTEEKDNNEQKNATPRQAMSSMEIQYASMSYMKRVTFSSTKVEAGSTCPPPLDQKESHSIHTIFNGHRKCPTPNLGTSVYSLCSEDNNVMISPKPLIMAQESKQKKPFLRRLMSCLVMRSARASELNEIVNLPVKEPSINSSIDSYHISTSLGAIEVSSSIYDTSASFYSNHSVYPVNSKMKRGFFNSVREFLTIRKS
ncbi:uncharacterized protein LOC135082222 isoform X1 [Ostrinia nubilalis]|uniref:uncharacterized protein LOC135082222 isoform X1 n=1 Tax=Ostrinia nubilalis TaxID=29057 RepID=UPI0030824D08